IQTFRGPQSKDVALATFSDRLQALARATELLTHSNWEHVLVADAVEAAIRPYGDKASARIAPKGAEALIAGQDALSPGLALHELCTNAVKYGALSVDGGLASIEWSAGHGAVDLEWRETGGPLVEPPARGGFGTRLLRDG